MADFLLREFSAATAGVKRVHFDLLEKRGVPHEFLWRNAMRFGIARIAVLSDGTYQPIEDGMPAIIVPANPLLSPAEFEEGDDINDIGDLIAWTPKQPDTWSCRTGTVPFLNGRAISAAEYRRERLKVCATPLAWMQAGGEGIVILDRRAYLPFWLGGLTDIIADPPDFAREIDRRLEEQAAARPRVLVPWSA